MDDILIDVLLPLYAGTGLEKELPRLLVSRPEIIPHVRPRLSYR